MKTSAVVKKAGRFAEPFRVAGGKNFRLRDFVPADTLWLKSEDKPRAKEMLAVGVPALAGLQDKLKELAMATTALLKKQE